MKIYSVSEDNHGVVSYWDSKFKARVEAVKIIKQMYLDNESEYMEMSDDELIDEFCDVVQIDCDIEINKSWIDN